MIKFNILSMNHTAKENPPFFLCRRKGVNNYLLLLFKSHGELTIKNKIFKYSPNDLVILNIGTPHTINTLNAILVHDWIHFNADSDKSFLSSGIIFDKLLPCPFADTVSNLIKMINAEFIGQYHDPMVTDYLMNTMVTYILRGYCIVKQMSTSDMNLLRQFDNLRNELSINCNKYSSIADMSYGICLSQSRFCHLYKKFYHIPPIQDLINFKIQTAKRLLLTTDCKIKDIAERCGFTNEFSFIRCFKSKTGQTPHQWRQ